MAQIYFGAALLWISATLLAWLVLTYINRRTWTTHIEPPNFNTTSQSIDEDLKKWDEHQCRMSRRRHMIRTQIIATATFSLFLAGSFLWLQFSFLKELTAVVGTSVLPPLGTLSSPPPDVTNREYCGNCLSFDQGGSNPRTGGTGQPPPAAPLPGTSAVWGVVTAGIAILAAGTVLLLFGSSMWAKIGGAGALVVGLTASGHFVKEINIGDIFKFETKIEKPTLEISLARKIVEQIGSFGPERLVTLDNFVAGHANFVASHMVPPLSEVCRKWTERGGKQQRGLLLVIGSTDRSPLGPAARARYESNVGLARARAEQVKERLLDKTLFPECLIKEEQVVTLVSGPRFTPEGNTAFPGGEENYGKDRSVSIWALWALVPEKLADITVSTSASK